MLTTSSAHSGAPSVMNTETEERRTYRRMEVALTNVMLRLAQRKSEQTTPSTKSASDPCANVKHFRTAAKRSSFAASQHPTQDDS